jgi:predicted restriction endonuclease
MEQLDHYLFNLDKKYIIKSDLLKKYNEFDYEDEDYMELDLDLLLAVKYKHLKISETKEERKDQKKFRKKLLELYPECIITGNNCETELDAAHIIPHSEGGDYSINNGLILNTNIHRTFDKYLWSINPDTLVIECKNNYNIGTIKKYKNTKLNLNLNKIIKKKLEYHYNIFKNNNN